MRRTVAVVTDSAASLPPDVALAWGVRVVPLHVVVDGVARAEGSDIAPAEVLAALVAGSTVTTSQPGIGAFDRAYAAAVSGGATAIVAVMMSAELSSTADAAEAAAHTASVPVTVVDTRTVAMATGFAALAAAALAAEGADAADVADEARRVAATSLCLFTVDTLEYLRKGGRVGPAVAAVGKVLGVRPVLKIADGSLVVEERVRTTARARAALVARVGAAIASMERPAVAVMTLDDGEVAADTVAALTAAHPGLAMTVRSTVSAVLSAHAGPGALAIVVADMPARVS